MATYTYNYNNPGTSTILKVPTLKQGDTLRFNNTSTSRSGVILEWTVPLTGEYEIRSAGAAGGNVSFNNLEADGGQGAVVTSTEILEKGDVLRILVGQAGLSSTTKYHNPGGGGASIVYNKTSEELLGIGGGGGGGSIYDSISVPGKNAQASKYTNSPTTLPSLGDGGWSPGATGGSGGAGYKGNGKDGEFSSGGTKFALGGFGGEVALYGRRGGFGGGGAGGYSAGGGGGGYTGGNGGYYSEGIIASGGGGSYTRTAMASPNYALSINHGYVRITLTNTITAPQPPSSVNLVGKAVQGAVVSLQCSPVNFPTQVDGSSSGIVYYSFDFYDGSTWREVATGVTENTVNYTLPLLGTSLICKIRARAHIIVGGINYYSNYRERSSLAIMVNTPSMPSSFDSSISKEYLAGSIIGISWKKSTDSLGDTIYYEVDLYDGTAWSLVATNLLNTSYSFEIPSGLETKSARLRVRAKVKVASSYSYSGYLYSDFFSVSNFSALDKVGIPFLQDVQKKENIDYLRGKVDEMREGNRLGLVSWTDPLILREETPIKPIHWQELDEAILEVYSTAKKAPSNPKTEAELRRVKVYETQTDLLQALPERMSTISRGLTNE